MEEEKKEYASTYDGGVTEEQVNKWKARHGKVFRIDVADGDELHVGWFRRPSIETMAAATKVAKTDDVKASEVIFDNCWLGGSAAMRGDAVVFMAATVQLSSIFNSCVASIKNL